MNNEKDMKKIFSLEERWDDEIYFVSMSLEMDFDDAQFIEVMKDTYDLLKEYMLSDVLPKFLIPLISKIALFAHYPIFPERTVFACMFVARNFLFYLENPEKLPVDDSISVTYNDVIPFGSEKTEFNYNFYDGDMTEVCELIDAFKELGTDLYA